MKTKIIILLIIFNFLILTFFVNFKKKYNIDLNKNDDIKETTNPIEHDVSISEPSFLQYQDLVKQIKLWEQECPELVEVGIYGKSTKQQDLYYIRIKNKRIKEELPKVLITACIHGNEPLATSTTMWYIGSLLKNYNDNKIQNLIDSRDLYFVPVVSPDSYPKSRMVDGVDPNRNFPGSSNPDKKSVAPVRELQDFFLKIKPQAVMSGHTYGRVYLMPPGDSMSYCPDHEEFVRVLDKMSQLSGYRYIRACDLYMATSNPNTKPIRSYGVANGDYKVMVPIYGTETDWYYRNGAFAIVAEYGTHQRIPSNTDTNTEFDKTYEAMLCFLQEAPLVNVTPNFASQKQSETDYKIDFRDE